MQDFLSLDQLLKDCTNPSGENWEKAWLEFFRRYKDKLYFFIKGSCLRWQIPRLHLQMEEVINDIISEVMILLHQKLTTFKNTNSEKKLLAWMQIICNRETGHYIQKIFNKKILDLDLTEVQELKAAFKDEALWEVYEKTVESLRDLLKDYKYHERDIHIFLLNIWSGFPPKQIVMHPYFNKFTPNSIEVIISRIRKKIINF